LKYSEIYKKIRTELAKISHRIIDMRRQEMRHKDWVQLDKIDQCIDRLIDTMQKFNIKIVEDGGSTV